MPSGSWNNKGVSIQSSDFPDAGYAFQSLYQPVVKAKHQSLPQQQLQQHHHQQQQQQCQHQHHQQQMRDGFTLESHHFMDLSQVLKEVEDEGSLIPSPTRVGDRKRRRSDDEESPSEDDGGYTRHASIEQLKNTYSISLDSLNENNVEVSCRVPQERCRIDYDSDKTPTVDKSFWSESDDDSPVVEGCDSCYFGDEEGNNYPHVATITGTVLGTPTNLNTYLPPCDQDIEKEIRNIGVVTDQFELNNEPAEDYSDDEKSCSSHDATSSASSESLRSAYSLQTPALSSSPESYEMLYRSFEVAAMMDKERQKNGVDISDPPEESLLDVLNKASPKLQRLNYHREETNGNGLSSSQESSPSSLTSSRSSGADAAPVDLAEHHGFNLQPLMLDCTSTKAHSAEDLSSSRVITFAQIAQQRRRPEPKEMKQEKTNQENLLHWTELLSSKGASSSAQEIPGAAGASCESQEQLPDAPRRPQSLPIQLRHLQKPTIRPHATPPPIPKGVYRTLSAPEGIGASQRTCKSWGERDEGIGELSESEAESLSPDPVDEPSPAAPPSRPEPEAVDLDDTDFSGLVPQRRHRTTTWCGSFSSIRRPLLSSREHLSDTDSLDSWQPPPPQPTDINANVAPNGRSSSERREGGVSALYDARSTPLNTSLCRKNFLSSRESIQRTRKRHYCKDTYAERMLQHGGVFISGTENKPFLLQDIDSDGKAGAVSSTAKTRSLPRNLGVARRRGGASSGGRSRPKSMEGLTSFSTNIDSINPASWTQPLAPLYKSKSQEETLCNGWDSQKETDAVPTVPGMSAMQQQWNASDEADYASLNSFLLGKSEPKEETRVTCEDLPDRKDQKDLFHPSRRIIRIDNVAKDAEVKYIKHRPLKPIHVVDAEHHRKKVLERLSILQPPSSAPPTGLQPQDWQSFSQRPTAATKKPSTTTGQAPTTSKTTRSHRRQKSDVGANPSSSSSLTTTTTTTKNSQSQPRRDSFWAWATSRQPIRTKNMSGSDRTSGQAGSSAGGLRDNLRPLALKVAHDDWDTLESLPPQVMRVSPREEAENAGVDVLQKRALVAEVNAAVDQLLAHFAQAKSGQPEEKARLGNTWKTPDIGHLTLHYLCPALMRILQDGLRSHSNSLLVGRIKNTSWTVVEATTQLGPGTRLLHELSSTVSKDIRLKDSKLRTHAFFLGLLNIRCMETWLEHIKTHPESIRRLYEPTAFLSLICHAPFQQLFSDLLVAVQPLAQLPFNLDHGFEYGYIQAESMRQREQQQLMEQHKESMPIGSLNTNSLVDARQHPEANAPTSGFPTVRLFGRPPRRDSAPSQRPVNTGMYSSMTVMRNMRRVTPVGTQESSEQPTMHGGLLRTVNSTPAENRAANHELEVGGAPRRPLPQSSQSNRWSLGWIKDFATSVAVQQTTRAPAWSESRSRSTASGSRNSVGSETRRSKSVDIQPGSVVNHNMGLTSGWGKLGASFTKIWNQVMQPQPVEPKPLPATPPPTPLEEETVREGGDGQSPSQQYTSPIGASPKTTPGSPVKALCHHVSMTEGELCFSKGDVLTVDRQVDPDWLLCSHGNETGLVHIEYVQGLE